MLGNQGKRRGNGEYSRVVYFCRLGRVLGMSAALGRSSLKVQGRIRDHVGSGKGKTEVKCRLRQPCGKVSPRPAKIDDRADGVGGSPYDVEPGRQANESAKGWGGIL